MKPSYELFQDMKPETALSVFHYLRDEQRDVYKATLSSLAANRKLRPVFIQRKPVPEQIQWMLKNIKLRGSDEVATQVLQLWLLKGNSALLVSFLDGLGIEHDGEGAVDDLPDELDAKKLKSTVAALVKAHDPEVVAIYLHIFQLQRPGGWELIEELIQNSPELRLGGAELDAAASAEPSPSAADETGAEPAGEGGAVSTEPVKKTAKKTAKKAEESPSE